MNGSGLVERLSARREVALAEILIGDSLVVFPHEICPVDGVVTEGHGGMDEVRGMLFEAMGCAVRKMANRHRQSSSGAVGTGRAQTACPVEFVGGERG